MIFLRHYYTLQQDEVDHIGPFETHEAAEAFSRLWVPWIRDVVELDYLPANLIGEGEALKRLHDRR